MERVERTISFSITGEYITETAREWLCEGTHSYDKIMDFLLSCLDGTDEPKEVLTRIAEDILLGRAEITGNTADNTYALKTYGAKKQPKLPDERNPFMVIGRLGKELQETKKELRKMQEWYSVAMSYVPAYDVDNVLEETGQIETSFQDQMLKSYMERAKDNEVHTTDDYGWLEPNGTFHEVEWAEHQEWAEEYIKAHFPKEEWLTAEISKAGDYLTERGWVLLHSPARGIATPTKHPLKRYTKAQKEFLYDYYMERKQEKEANKIFEEDE